MIGRFARARLPMRWIARHWRAILTLAVLAVASIASAQARILSTVETRIGGVHVNAIVTFDVTPGVQFTYLPQYQDANGGGLDPFATLAFLGPDPVTGRDVYTITFWRGIAAKTRFSLDVREIPRPPWDDSAGISCGP